MENTDKKKLLIANIAALTVIVVVLTVLAINGTGAVSVVDVQRILGGRIHTRNFGSFGRL